MIVGVCGQKRHGKDTCANVLTSYCGFKKYSFAESIRECLKEIFIWNDDWIDNHKEEIDPYWGISYRQAAQDLGTEWGRTHLPEKFSQFKEVTSDTLWIRRAEKYIMQEENKNWVIPDVRFPNEAEFIEKNNGILLRVIRPDMMNQGDMHPSEVYASTLKVDHEIINEGTITDLTSKILSLAKGWTI